MSAPFAEALARDGYALLPELLDAASVAELCAQLSGNFECLQFPHLASDAFLNALLRPAALALLREAMGPELKLAQSIVLRRPGGSPGMAWHRDRDYFEAQEPLSGPVYGVWIALDDAAVDNGCLEVRPGSHREAPPAGEAFALEVHAGAGIVYHGGLVHRTLDNRRTGPRRALIGHFTPADEPSRWDGANRRVRVADVADVEIVGGATPFVHPASPVRS